MSTLSQNNIVVNYVLNDDQVNKAKTAYDKLTDAEKKAVDETRKLNDQLKKTGQEGSESAKKVGNEMNNITSLAKSGAGLLAGFFAVSSIQAFGKSVFNVTAEFEKMQAVLKNTLGSNSAAMLSMETIKNFAKTTPFSVQELTASFVKLANQGFKPNIDQMKRLGDLASSTGKTFDQLTEAIIDAQVGEFERLKEFGVRAQKQGDLVKFTFKGVETQTQFTNQAIREYILSLGDLNGVSGASAAISETLGGKVNNLGDAWDNFLNKIGTLLKPVLTEALTVTAEFMDGINNLFGKGKTDAERFAGTELQTYKAYQKSVINLTDDQLIAFVSKQKESLNTAQKDFIKYSKEANKLGKATREAAELGFGSKEIADAAKASEAANQDIAAAKGRIAAAEEQIKLREIATASVTQQKVSLSDAELKALKEQYDAKLKLLDIEKRIADINIEVTTEREDERTIKLLENAENFGKQKLVIDKKYAALGVVAAQDDAKLQTAIVKKQENDITVEIKKQREEREKARADYEKKLADDEADSAKKLLKIRNDAEDARAEHEMKSIKDLEKVRRDAEEARAKYEKKLEQDKQELIQASFDLAADTTNALFDLQSQYAANDFARKQKQFDEEVRLADGNVQKLTEIEERRRAAEKEYREKEFRANQAQAIANVIFNTAPIIAQYLAKVVTAPLAIIAAAAATAQIGFILAQPVPEFAEGTKGKAFKGKAIVGEKGTELVTTLSGKQYYTPPTATLAQFDEPVHITPNHLLGLNDKYLSSQYFNNSGKKDTSGMQIVTKLEAIENGLKNMPVAAISLDEKGFMKKVRTPNRSTTILNNRFKN